MGRLIVPTSGRIYVDANTVIYRGERSEPYYSLTVPIWDALDHGLCELITSELTFFEVLVKPLRDGNSELISIYRTVLLASDLSCLPIDRAILEVAASLRATYRLKTPIRSMPRRPSGTEARCSSPTTPAFGRSRG